MEYIIAIIVSIMTSSGFWAYIQARNNKNDSKIDLLKGLAHDRIVWVGKFYIERGWLTYDEYDDFMTYLFEPYCNVGGNGYAVKIKEKLENLPMHEVHPNIRGDGGNL